MEGTLTDPARGVGSAAPDFVRATVCDGSLTMRYRRAGSGRTVLVLGELGPLSGSLAARFRVVVPEIADAPAPGWLPGFLDALGAPAVVVLADARHALAALAFTLMDPDSVQALVLVTDAGVPAGLWEDLARIRRPLLVCSGRPGGADEIAAFLREAALRQEELDVGPSPRR